MVFCDTPFILAISASPLEVPVFYLSTVSDSRPKCRPIGFHLLQDGNIYFGVGTFKDVYRQLEQNPYAEICAYQGGRFLRYYGKAVFEDNEAIAAGALEKSPGLQKSTMKLPSINCVSP